MRILVPILLIACSTDSAPPASKPAPTPAPAPAPADQAKPTAADTAPAAHSTPAAQNEQDEQDHEKIGLEMMKNETIGGLRIGASAAEVEKLAGKAKKSKPEMSEALGMYTVSWAYPEKGLDVWMVAEKKKGPYQVLTLRITKAGPIGTSKGIAVGTPVAEVDKVYRKNPSESTENQAVVGTLYGGLMFEFADGKVSAIFLGAAAE